MAIILFKNCSPSASLRRSSSSATLLWVAFCSSLSWCRTDFAATFLFCNVWATILKTEAVDMFASCAISSHDMHWSSSNRVLTITTDVSSVAITGRPLLGSSWMLTTPSRKRDAHRDTMLWSTTLSLQTSCKALWISVGFFSHKVSILMYDRWPLHKIWLQLVSSSISRLHFAEQGPRSLPICTQRSLLKSGSQLSWKSEQLHHPTGYANTVCRTFEMTYVYPIRLM